MRRVAERDESAVRTLYARFYPMIVQFVARHANPDDDEDIAHEAIIAAWRNARKFDPAKASLKTWITRIAQRKQIDLWRRERCRVRDVPLDAAGGVAAVERTVDTDGVDRALSRLSDTQRERFMLLARGTTYRAIATMDGVPIGTVKSSLWWGREKAKGLQ